ncbi:MAG: DUF3990 domain-containing protein [Bacteroidaceae bacterium]|nr:DUF3990 domain-containing protein [Bacteroidaceae bacterium]
MKLYHGSNTKVEKPDLKHSKPFKDFGCGFYLSAEKEQAWEMARLKVNQTLTDDGVTYQLRRYEGGVISLARLVEELKYAKGITFQYYFGSEKALRQIKLS